MTGGASISYDRMTTRPSPEKIAPSTAQVPLRVKLSETGDLFRDYGYRMRLPLSWDVFGDLERYDELLQQHADRSLRDARVFEIGYGPRPYRLMALRSMGVDVRGVDAEVPILRNRPAEYLAAYRRNGIERVAKSAVRRALFDWREDRAFERALAERGQATRVERERLMVADAGTLDLPPGSLDLIYSENVFEHIGLASLRALVPKMARWLARDGIALVRPNVFTGITGGHLVEWNRRSLLTGCRSRRRTRPWEHLLSSEFHANTYLNRLHRREYRTLFATDFEILAEEVALPGLGKEFLTPELALALAEHGADELFSNEVRFVLRPRAR